jgi:hypothetical protein
VVVNNILTINGQGFFQIKDRAPDYIARILDLDKDLHEKGMTAARARFRQNISKKLNDWAATTFNDGRVQSLPGEKLPGKKTNPNFTGEHALLALLKRGFINWDLVKNSNNKAFKENLVKQFKSDENDNLELKAWVNSNFPESATPAGGD